jgi:hypothetical protein
LLWRALYFLLLRRGLKTVFWLTAHFDHSFAAFSRRQGGGRSGATRELQQPGEGMRGGQANGVTVFTGLYPEILFDFYYFGSYFLD